MQLLSHDDRLFFSATTVGGRSIAPRVAAASGLLVAADGYVAQLLPINPTLFIVFCLVTYHGSLWWLAWGLALALEVFCRGLLYPHASPFLPVHLTIYALGFYCWWLAGAPWWYTPSYILCLIGLPMFVVASLPLLLDPLGWPNVLVWYAPCYVSLMFMLPAWWLRPPFRAHEPPWCQRWRQSAALLWIVGYPALALWESLGQSGLPSHPALSALLGRVIIEGTRTFLGESQWETTRAEARTAGPPAAFAVPAPTPSPLSPQLTASARTAAAARIQREGRYAEAEAVLLSVISTTSPAQPPPAGSDTVIYPEAWACHLELARTYYYSDRLPEATELCKRLLRALDVPIGGDLASWGGRFSAADSLDVLGAARGACHLLLGNALMASGRPTEAFNHYDAARVEFERDIDPTIGAPPTAAAAAASLASSPASLLASIRRDEQLALALCGLSAVAEKQGLVGDALTLCRRAEILMADAEGRGAVFHSGSCIVVLVCSLSCIVASKQACTGALTRILNSHAYAAVLFDDPYYYHYFNTRCVELRRLSVHPDVGVFAVLRPAMALMEELRATHTLFFADEHATLAHLILEGRGTPGAGMKEVARSLMTSLSIRQRLLPPDHPDIAACWATLAVAYRRVAREEMAAEAAANALRVGRRSQTACARGGCGRKVRPDEQPLDVCVECLRTFYCGPACQKADWKAGHRAECKVLVAEGAATLSVVI